MDTYYETHNVVDKVSEDYLSRDEWDNRTYQDLLDEYFEDNPSHWEQHQSSVWAQVDEIIDNIMFRDVSDYFLKVSSEATILYNPETITIEYYCPDVLTAMYMMANVALFNLDNNSSNWRGSFAWCRLDSVCSKLADGASVYIVCIYQSV